MRETAPSHLYWSGTASDWPPAASFSNLSASSFPGIPTCTGTQRISTLLPQETRREHTSIAALARNWSGSVVITRLLTAVVSVKMVYVRPITYLWPNMRSALRMAQVSGPEASLLSKW